MEKDLVSIVIPIYNVEKYLDRCIESVVNQTYRNLEILLIDDQSPDNCPRMCDDWAVKDNRIKVIHKKNGGLGMARNSGIEIATGEYICFLDSDDYIDQDTIEACVAAAREHQAEVVCFGMHRVNAEGSVVFSMVPNTGKTLFCGSEVQEYFLPELLSSDPNAQENTNLWISACGALFSMKTIQKSNWRLVSEREIISEDVYSLLALYKDVDRVAVLPRACYYYCENTASLTQTYRPDRFQKIKHFYSESKALCRRLNYSDAVIQRLSRQFIAFSIGALKQEASAPKPIKDNYASVKAIVEDPVLLEAVRVGKGKLDSKARKILFFAIEHKLHIMSFLLSRIKK